MIKIMASGSALSATTKHIGTQNTGNSSLTTARIVDALIVDILICKKQINYRNL